MGFLCGTRVLLSMSTGGMMASGLAPILKVAGGSPGSAAAGASFISVPKHRIDRFVLLGLASIGLAPQAHKAHAGKRRRLRPPALFFYLLPSTEMYGRTVRSRKVWRFVSGAPLRVRNVRIGDRSLSEWTSKSGGAPSSPPLFFPWAWGAIAMLLISIVWCSVLVLVAALWIALDD